MTVQLMAIIGAGVAVVALIISVAVYVTGGQEAIREELRAGHEAARTDRSALRAEMRQVREALRSVRREIHALGERVARIEAALRRSPGDIESDEASR